VSRNRVLLALFILYCVVVVAAIAWASTWDEAPECIATGSQQVTRDVEGGSTLVWKTAIEKRCQ
jgi:hypothetical protein